MHGDDQGPELGGKAKGLEGGVKEREPDPIVGFSVVEQHQNARPPGLVAEVGQLGDGQNVFLNDAAGDEPRLGGSNDFVKDGPKFSLNAAPKNAVQHFSDSDGAVVFPFSARAKVIKRLRVATGSGETTGSHMHKIDLDMVNAYAAKSLLWNIPRQGPTRRGQTICWNWQVCLHMCCACGVCQHGCAESALNAICCDMLPYVRSCR